MMKKAIKHALVLVMIAAFTLLAMGSMGSSPSSSSSSSSYKKVTCVMCGGSGRVNSSFPGEPANWVTCPTCKGSGYEIVR